MLLLFGVGQDSGGGDFVFGFGKDPIGHVGAAHFAETARDLLRVARFHRRIRMPELELHRSAGHLVFVNRPVYVDVAAADRVSGAPYVMCVREATLLVVDHFHVGVTL